MSWLWHRIGLRRHAQAQETSLRTGICDRIRISIHLGNARALHASFDCRVVWFENRGKRNFIFFETTDELLVGIDLTQALAIEWSSADVDASIATPFARNHLTLGFRDRSALQRSLLTTRDIDRLFGETERGRPWWGQHRQSERGPPLAR